MRDIISIIQFGGAFTALLMAVAIFLVARKHDRHDLLLAWIMILIGTILLRTGISVSGWLAQYPHQLGVLFPLTYLIGPLLLFYSRAKLLDQPFRTHRFLPHCLPMVCGYLMLVPVFLLPVEKKLAYLNLMPQPGLIQRAFNEFSLSASINLLQIFTIWLFLGAYAWVSWRIMSSTQTPSQIFGNNQARRWISFLSLGLLVISGMIFFSHLGVLFFEFTFFSPLLMAAYLCIVLIAGYAAIQLVLKPGLLHPEPPVVIDDNQPDFDPDHFGQKNSLEIIPASVRKYENSGLRSKEAKELAVELKRLMKEEMLYRQHDLTLQLLAEKLDCPPKHLSQVLNERLCENFYEFINRYRVGEVKQQLAKNGSTKLPIIDIALNAGFNNKPAFYNAFRKNTGMTPTEYIKHKE